jgi:hypothetical protein
MFCLLGSDTEQHFDVAAQMSYRAHQGWTESYEKSIPITSFRLRTHDGGASSLFGLQANGSDSNYSTRHSRIPLFAMADSVISSAQSRKNSKAAAFRELSSAVTVE